MVLTLCCSHLIAFSDSSNEFLAKSVKNSDEDFFLTILEVFLDVVFDLLEMLFLWEVDVGLNFTLFVEELESGVINIKKGVFNSFDDWSINHITSVISALIDLVRENIFSLQNDLG
tara:strand:- start:9 stop:356 length:348 start_codon:yes stop_codon:yes gene_type:complete